MRKFFPKKANLMYSFLADDVCSIPQFQIDILHTLMMNKSKNIPVLQQHSKHSKSCYCVDSHQMFKIYWDSFNFLTFCWTKLLLTQCTNVKFSTNFLTKSSYNSRVLLRIVCWIASNGRLYLTRTKAQTIAWLSCWTYISANRSNYGK